MVDQLASAETCRVCGSLIDGNQTQADGRCSKCAGVSSSPPSGDAQSVAAATPFESLLLPQEATAPDPDRPRWGPLTGISVWLVSVIAIIVIPIIAVVVWYLIESARGAPLPNLADKDQMLEYLKSPNLLLVQVLSTIVAHAITIGICWAVVTKLGKQQFWGSLGWSWAGHSVWYWLIFSACVIVALLIATQLLSRFLPQSEENSFTELLRSSRSVRIAIAVLATFTAPLVEETVYRGILFSSLRRNLGSIATVLVVTIMFAGVHVLQYLGAWVSIAGLTLLSLALTLIRARTKSILPCVMIHTLNNAFFSMLILLNKAS
jgi:membrane protease YdiL (CAAX protease family)